MVDDTALEYQRYQTGAQPFWTPLRFPGQYHDAETDLFENWNRYYDPNIGTYLQPEPIMDDPQFDIGLARRGYGIPAYAYAGNNPIRHTDSTGMMVDDFNFSRICNDGCFGMVRTVVF